MATPSGESDRDRILAKVKPEFHEAFLQFIRTGKSSPEFEAYHDSSIECQEAVCDAFAMQSKVFQEMNRLVRDNPPQHEMFSKTSRFLLLLFIFLLGSICGTYGTTVWLSNYNTSQFQAQATPTEVHFSPNGGCQDQIIKSIGDAKKQIRVFSYSFTSEPIAHALILQQMGGIDVQVVIDSGSAKHSEIENLVNNGVMVWIDSSHAIQHSKVVIIDDEIVLTGSYNYSNAAEERNSENLITIKSKNVAARYLAEWEKHRKHSTKKVRW